MRLSGYRVLLTGATGGIGQALAHAFSAEGAFLCLAGRDLTQLQRLQQALPGASSAWVADLSHRDQVLSLPQRITTAEGPLDILINNGGVTQDQLALRMKDDAWDQVLQVNLTAAFQLSREVLRGMIKKNWGRIINISSVVAVMGNAGQANYVASKAGLLGLTKVLALEVASRGITVNAIAPGFIDTAMTKKLPHAVLEEIFAKVPCKKLGTPEDVAYGALFLADPRAAYITGETLHINGGMGMF